MSTALGKDGAVIGSKLETRLKELEKNILGYPFEIGYNHIKDTKQRSAIANTVERAVSYIECSVGLYKGFHKGKISQSLSFLENPFSPEIASYMEEATAATFQAMDVSENLKDAAVNESYIIIGKPKFSHATDGDTIIITPERIGKEAKSQGITTDDISIRYAGVQTPETDKSYVGQDSVEYSNKRNLAYAQYFGVTVEDAYEIAEEAKTKNRYFLGADMKVPDDQDQDGDYYILVHLDRDASGFLIKAEGRPVGVLYQTNMKKIEDVLKAIGSGTAAFRNINKSILKETSTKFKGLPLAYMEYDDVYGRYNNTTLNPLRWANELKLNIFDTGTNEKPTGVDQGVYKETINSLPQDDDSDIDGDITSSVNIEYSQDYLSNMLDFVKPNDDRFNEIFRYEDDVQYLKDSRVRIGDVLLTIPPLSISVDKSNTIQKVKTLRTKSSIMTNSGQAITTISMELYFHDSENVNGTLRKTGDYDFYVDGLRPLIAQFSKCPFVPIDNPYINNVLGIHEVALYDLTVSTVPGFPHSISATITLAKFNSSAYMPNTPFLGEIINYPLMRWFYQRSMVNPKDTKYPDRTYFQEITEPLTNNFVFQVVDRNILESRKNAINSINSMDTPEKLREEAKKGSNQIGVLLKDAERANDLLEKYEKYKKAKQDMGLNAIIESGSDIIHIREAYQTKYSLSDDEYVNAVEEGKSFYKKIYDSKVSAKGNEIFFHETPTFYSYRIGERPIESYYSDQGSSYYTGSSEWPHVPEKVVNNMSPDYNAGFLQIGLSAVENMGMLPSEWKAGKQVDGATGYYIPLTADGIAKLQKIADKETDANKILDEYENNYRGLESLINVTENELPTSDFTIKGLIPTSLNVMYSNQFATLPVLEADSPSLQYLGSQDPYIQVTFEVPDEGLKDVNRLMELVNEYSRTYRQGISTGFLLIENQLAHLFGIRSVMIESARFTTVPNFPGRNQVQMTLVGFNKTQRRAEQLSGFNGVTKSSSSLSSTQNNKNQKNTDAIVEMRLRKMEVYPDLELPTYEELNEAIPKLKIDLPEYINRTGSLYVDPDFYVSTTWTFRDVINKNYLGDHTLYMKDSSGLQMTTSPSSDRILDGDDENWDIIKSLSREAPKVESMFKWDENSIKENDNDGDGDLEPVTYMNEEIKKYMTEKDEKGVFSYQKKPSYEEWISWRMATKAEYDIWKENPQPTESEVFHRMYRKASELFKDLYGVQFVKKKELNTSQERACYSPSKYFYALLYELNKDYLSKKELSALKKRTKGEDAEFTPPKVDKSKADINDLMEVIGIIPFERVFGAIKALFHYASKWKQFTSSGKPLIDAAINSCGIAGIPIADEANDLAEAKRLLWDWRYNVDKGMERIANLYREAVKGDKVKKIEFRSRPWEVMVYAYVNGKQPATAAELDKDSTLISVLDIFNKFYVKEGRWGSPSTPVNVDIYSGYLELSKSEKKFINGKAKKEDFINALVNDLAYRWKFEEYGLDKSKYADLWKKYLKDTDQDHWYSDPNDDKDEKAITKIILEEHSPLQVKSIFQKRIKELKADEDWNEKHPILGLFEDGWDAFTSSVLGNPETTEVGEEIVQSVGGYLEAVDNTLNNRLVGDSDPQQLYREMYTDLIKYDHRGRLVRAFPAFQMLIIDEGQWMGRFKFWDNMYGFNSIESIDVYRSRKIAADTAVIRMTNVYSNLTTRRIDLNYQDRKTDFWNNLIWENPTEELLEANRQILKQMMIQAGARVHLRMGYGSDAASMPIVFNGTVTEMDTQEVVEIVCQGDGIELGNIVSGDPDDDNAGFFQVTEPRDLICELLTSKGSWFNDVINNMSDGRFMRNNPLGIMHFGVPGELAPPGTLGWANSDYGEAAQNVYSSNGTPSFSQWSHPDGSKRNLFSGSFWKNITTTNITKWFNPGDEDNIIVKFYNNTTWDIIQTLTYCSLDYIAAVHPFETRSTLFFGKPYWRMAHAYSSKYEWDEAGGEDQKGGWVRKINVEHRKPYMQIRYYDSYQDIIQNAIKVSEDGVFTNAIVNYDGEQTPILSADYDIRYDKQKTQVIDAEIVARFAGVDYWTSEDQARAYGMSAVRDSLKDMYKGSLTVIGDPSVKPHDAMYLSDFTSTMNGITLVKAVTHHMSIETGFVSSVEPDAYVVNDDLVMLSSATWATSALVGTAATMMGLGTATAAVKKIQQSKTVGKLVKAGKGSFEKLEQASIKIMLDSMGGDGSAEFKAYRDAFEELYSLDKNASKAAKADALKKLDKAADGLNDLVKSKKKAYKDKKKFLNFFNKNAKEAKEEFTKMRFLARKSKAINSALRLGKSSKGLALKSAFQVGKAAFGATGIGLVIELGVTIAVESIFEAYSRYKEALQCVIMIPLRYRGNELTAGINGHKGMVVGDQPGKLDMLVSAQFGKDESDEDQDWYNWVFETMNFLTSADKEYSVSQEQLANSSTSD